MNTLKLDIPTAQRLVDQRKVEADRALFYDRLAPLIIVAVVCLFTGGVFTHWYLLQSAVKVGAGEFYIDSGGHREFRWNGSSLSQSEKLSRALIFKGSDR